METRLSPGARERFNLSLKDACPHQIGNNQPEKYKQGGEKNKENAFQVNGYFGFLG